MTGQHRNPDPPPRARWLPWGIGITVAVLVPASLIAMRVGDALSVDVDQTTKAAPGPGNSARNSPEALSAARTETSAPTFEPPNIPTIGAEGHWTPPGETTQATTNAVKPPERRSEPRTVAPRHTVTPKPAPTVTAPTTVPTTEPAPTSEPTPTEPAPEPLPVITLPTLPVDVLPTSEPTEPETSVEPEPTETPAETDTEETE